MTSFSSARGWRHAMLALALAAGQAWAATERPLAAAHAAYDTQLFNLLLPGKSLVDGKVHYDAALSRKVDALLAASTYAREGKPRTAQAFLKKRLLSGPAPKPRSVALAQDKGSEQAWLYYKACQAHACDVTNLGLLYQPDSARAVALLRIDGKTEHLGQPSTAEKALLADLDATAEEKKP